MIFTSSALFVRVQKTLINSPPLFTLAAVMGYPIVVDTRLSQQHEGLQDDLFRP